MSKTGKAPVPTKQFRKMREQFRKMREPLKSGKDGELDGFLFKVYATVPALVLHIIFCHQLAIRVMLCLRFGFLY